MYNYKSFDMSIIGQSHINKNKICQDYTISYYDSQMAIAIVCDGHGGNEYFRSDKGAKFACECALSSIRQFMEYENIFLNKSTKNIDEILNQLTKNIIAEWNMCVYKDAEENEFTEDEISSVSEDYKIKIQKKEKIESVYGTTLIATVISKNYLFCLQIGDGNCTVIYNDGTIESPIPTDDKCMFNVTTSLCDSNAYLNFRHYYSDKIPDAVFISTDGVENSFKNQKALNDFFKKVLESFQVDTFENAYEELEKYLPQLSRKGSGDDLSISGILKIASNIPITELKDIEI